MSALPASSPAFSKYFIYSNAILKKKTQNPKPQPSINEKNLLNFIQGTH